VASNNPHTLLSAGSCLQNSLRDLCIPHSAVAFRFCSTPYDNTRHQQPAHPNHCVELVKYFPNSRQFWPASSRDTPAPGHHATTPESVDMKPSPRHAPQHPPAAPMKIRITGSRPPDKHRPDIPRAKKRSPSRVSRTHQKSKRRNAPPADAHHSIQSIPPANPDCARAPRRRHPKQLTCR